jgi:hypothetical protein
MSKLIPAILGLFVFCSILGSVLSGSGGMVATVLTTPMTDTDDHAHVVGTDGFQTTGYITIQEERLIYGGVTTTTFTTLLRAQEGTVAASHPLVSGGLRVKVYTEDAGAVNKALGFDIGAIAATNGIFGIPKIAFQFFSTTIPHIIGWDCLSFLTGQLVYIRWIIIIITVGFVVAFAIQLGNMLASALVKVIP